MTFTQLAAKYDLARAPSANPTFNTVVFMALEGMIGDDSQGLVIPSLEATRLPHPDSSSYFVPCYARKNNKRSLNLAMLPNWTDKRYVHMDLNPDTVQNYVRHADNLPQSAKVLSPMTYRSNVLPCLNVPTMGLQKLPQSAENLQSAIAALPDHLVYSAPLEA